MKLCCKSLGFTTLMVKIKTNNILLLMDVVLSANSVLHYVIAPVTTATQVQILHLPYSFVYQFHTVFCLLILFTGR